MQSLDVLRMAKEHASAGTLTKTRVMLGCAETPDQVVKTMEKVRAAGVGVMTFGQSMRPPKRHMQVAEYVTLKAFERYRLLGMEMGFRYVASGPMVRSSYKAAMKGYLVQEEFSATISRTCFVIFDHLDIYLIGHHCKAYESMYYCIYYQKRLQYK